MLQQDGLERYAAEATADLDRRFAVIDLETTGLSPDTSSIVEVAIVELNSNAVITRQWSSLIEAPGIDEPGASAIHGITRAMLAGAPSFAVLIDEIAEQLRDHIIIGHVVAFDLAQLVSECARVNYRLPDISSVSICTRDLARRHLPDGSRTLQSCCDMVGVTVSGAHSALGDTLATAELFKYFCDRIDTSSYQQLMSNVASLSWPQRVTTTGASQAKPR